MLRSKGLVVAILAITFFSCSEEIVNPIDEDSLLKQSIIGEWGYRNSYVKCFYANGSFIDSSFSYDPTNYTKIVLFYVKSGKYNIEDKILYYYDVNYDVRFDTSSIGAGFSGTTTLNEIEFNNNYIILKSVDILTKISSEDGIFGQWETKRNVEHNISGPNGSEFYGQKFINYNFIKDTNIVINSWTYSENIPWSSGTDTLIYGYEFPFMSLPYNINLQYPNINVRFNGNKMFWYYTNEIWSLPKLK